MSEADSETYRVLVVDDDAHVCTALARSLRRLGYEVSEANDGEEGFAHALRDKPHVVITDIRMPQVDGHTFLRRLEAHDPTLPVIVTSAHGTMDDVVDVLRHGAVDYLKKPWTPSELVAAVVRAVEIGDKRKAAAAAAVAASASGDRLSKPAPGKGPSQPPQADPVLAGIAAQLQRGEITLPAVPSVVKELRVLVNRPDVTLDAVAALIERDARIATQVLQIANSAQRSRSHRSSDLRGAIARIGMRQVHGIVETICLHGCYTIREPKLAPLQRRLWRFAVARAISMRALTDLVPHLRLDADTAYTAGLLADTGASFLLWVHSERIVAGTKKPLQNLTDYTAALSAEHTSVGSEVLTRWGLDPIICSLAACHHNDAPAAPAHPYWTLSIVGSELANMLSPDDDITRECPLRPELVDRCQAELQMSALMMRKLIEQLEGEFKEIISTFR